jgi:hypothetical protein
VSKTIQVIHLAETRPDSNETGDVAAASATAPPTLESARGSVVSHHVKQLLRMLPGGLNVIGLYVIHRGDIFTQKYETNVKSLLGSLVRQLGKKANYAGQPEEEKVVFHYDSAATKFNCRVFSGDVVRSNGFEVVFGATKFLRVETDFDCSAFVRDGGDLKGDFNRICMDWEVSFHDIFLNHLVGSR